MSQQDIACPALIRCLMLQAMLSLLACAMEVAAAGVLTARRQFTFLVGAMLLSLGTVAAYCSAVRTYNWGLSGVWWGELLLKRRYILEVLLHAGCNCTVSAGNDSNSIILCSTSLQNSRPFFGSFCAGCLSSMAQQQLPNSTNLYNAVPSAEIASSSHFLH